jgi:hypothetical protein
MESDFWILVFNLNSIISGFTWTRSFPELLPELGHFRFTWSRSFQVLPELDHFRCLQLQYFRFRRPQPDHTGTEGDPIRARTWTKSTTRKTMFRQTPWVCVSICLFRFEISYLSFFCLRITLIILWILKLIGSWYNNTAQLIWVWKFWRLFLSGLSSKDYF